MSKTVLSVFDLSPRRIGGMELMAAELTRSLNAIGWRSILAFPAKPSDLVGRFLANAGAEVMMAPEISVGDMGAGRALFGLVKKTQAEHVHFHFTSFLTPMVWGSRLGGAKGIYFTDHTSRPQGEMPRAAVGAKLLIGKWMALPYKQVFCVCDFVRNFNTARGYVPPERLTTLYNGIDFAHISGSAQGLEFRKKFGIDSSKILVSQVSWLRPEKGLDVFIRAAATAARQDDRLHFLIAGDGPNREDYIQLCNQLGIANRVTFSGLVADPLGEGLYASSDVICLLSRWQEAFAYVILEAMANAKPLICTRVGGIPEAVEDGITGYIVTTEDADTAAKHMVSLSRDNELRLSLGKTAYDRVHQRFDLKGHIARLISYYGVS
jgi:glycosyltransferase involved in cell wall biosynthesis